MDIIAFNEASTANGRIESFIENPDSSSGIVTVPKTIASGENITIPAGRVAVLPNLVIDGVLNIENGGEVFIPSGATLGDLDAQLALKAPLSSPAFTNNPTAPTRTAGDNSTKLATTEYVDRKFMRGTAVATTSGTAIDFTGIPSWAKRITVLFNQVGINNSDKILLRVGSGSIVTSGYTSACSALYSAGDGVGNGIGTNTTGFLFDTNDGAFALSGSVEIFNLSGNLYVSNGSIGSVSGSATPMNQLQTGTITLSGALDRIRLTTVSGTAVFDGGSINIMYEG